MSPAFSALRCSKIALVHCSTEAPVVFLITVTVVFIFNDLSVKGHGGKMVIVFVFL